MAKSEKKNSEKITEGPVLVDEKPDPAESSSESVAETPETETTAAEAETAAPADAAETSERRPRGRPPGMPPKISIMEWVAKADWKSGRLWGYLYRQRPVTNLLLAGQKTVFVHKFDVYFDEQSIKEQAGSGTYMIQVTELQDNGQRKQVQTGEVRILDMAYPPKIPAGTWVNDPANKEWEWAKDLMEKKPPAAPAVDPMVEILKDTIAAQRAEMMEIRKELRERDAAANKKDPAEVTFLSVLAPFIPAIVQRLTAPPPAPPDPIAQLNATAALIKSLTPAPPPTPAHEVDPVKLLDAQLDLSKKIQDMVPQDRGGGRSRKTGWQEVISEIAPAAAEILKPFAQVIATGMMMQQHRMAQQQAQATPQQPPQPQLPAAAADAQQASQQTPQAAAAPPTTGPRIVKKQPTLDAFADQVLQTLQNKESGLDLGDWYLKEFGEDEFRELRLQGKEKILTDLKGAKEYRLIYPYGVSGELDKVIEDLLMWEPDEDEDDDDEDEAETPPIAADAMRSGWESETREETMV